MLKVFYQHLVTSFIVLLGIILIHLLVFSFFNRGQHKNNIEITLQDDERCSNINEVLNPALLKGGK